MMLGLWWACCWVGIASAYADAADGDDYDDADADDDDADPAALQRTPR